MERVEPPTPLAGDDFDSTMSKLRDFHASISSVLRSSIAAARDLAATDGRLSCQQEFFSGISAAIATLQSQSLANKALHSRINNAVFPSISLLRSLSRAERLEHHLLSISSPGSEGGTANQTIVYVDSVGRLSAAVATVTAECEPAVQRLQEAVEFLGRTKATDKLRVRRLRDAAGALRAVCGKEVERMRYEGPLDDALIQLQDEYEDILRRLRHPEVGDIAGQGEEDGEGRLEQGMDDPDWPTLGSAEDIDILGRISETLASNDCLDICIDIFVKVRYKQVAKALMRLNPDYLKTYKPDDIDRIEWKSLESSISMWMRHLCVAVFSVLAAEKHLARSVLSSAMDGAVWPECFAQISDRIMDVFFRFGEGVAESLPEPQKLFKLLEMTAAAVRLRPAIFLLFDDAAPEISSRFRELQKLLVQAASRAFSALENLSDPSPPPLDGSVPGVVRYVVNFLKCLVSESYAPAMAHVLRTESLWKAGFLSRPEPDGSLLRDAFARVLDALRRNVEAKRERCRDRVAAQLFAMNSYWYIYMRTRGTELAKIVGEEDMKKKYKAATEEAAYAYQVEAWAPVVRLLQGEGGRETGGVARVVARGKFEAFVREMEEGFKRHRTGGYKIPEKDLREQIREAVVGMVVPAYAGFLHAYSATMQGRAFPPPDALREKFVRLFDGSGGLAKARQVADLEPVPEEADTPGGVRLRARRRMEAIRSREGAERGLISPEKK